MAAPVALQSRASNSTTQTAAQRQTSLDTQSFLKLMTAQMSNQDPLNPVKDTEYFAQLAQLGQVQSLQSMEQTLKMSQIQSLIGKQVSGLVQTNGVANSVSGIVVGSSSQNGTYYLSVLDASGNVQDMPFDQVQATATQSTLTNFASLVGQQATGVGTALVNGTQKSVTAQGQVVGLTTSNGQTYARIQTADYGVVTVNVASLSKIGQ